MLGAASFCIGCLLIGTGGVAGLIKKIDNQVKNPRVGYNPPIDVTKMDEIAKQLKLDTYSSPHVCTLNAAGESLYKCKQLEKGIHIDEDGNINCSRYGEYLWYKHHCQMVLKPEEYSDSHAKWLTGYTQARQSFYFMYQKNFELIRDESARSPYLWKKFVERHVEIGLPPPERNGYERFMYNWKDEEC